MMTTGFPAVSELLPHKPPMIMIDAATGAGDDWVEAALTVTPAHPLFDVQENGLPGWVLIELMAQTIALYGGLRAHAGNEPVRIGYLLGTRRMALHRPLVGIGETLRIRAHCEFSDPDGLGSFYSTVHDSHGELVAEAKINVYQGNDGGLPE